MPYVTNEQIFTALFNLVKTAQILDWNNNPVTLAYATRNWVQVQPNSPEGQLPALYQLDPLPERLIRTGIGRSKRLLHALVDIRINRQMDPQSYPENAVFDTILNNWSDALRVLLSPTDTPLSSPVVGQSLQALVADYYPIDFKYDYGLGRGTIAVVQCIVEMYTGG